MAVHHTNPVAMPAANRVAGIGLGAATALMFAAMAHHPSEAGETDAATIAAIAASGVRGALVHGTLVSLFVMFSWAFVEFAVLLGLRRSMIRAALVAYLTGGIATIIAGTIDGFAVPALARYLMGLSPDRMRAGFDLIILASVIVDALIMLGLALMSSGIILWSLALSRGANGDRVTAAIGLGTGGAALALLLIRPAFAAPYLMMIVLLLHAVWNVAAARLLLRRRG